MCRLATTQALSLHSRYGLDTATVVIILGARVCTPLEITIDLLLVQATFSTGLRSVTLTHISLCIHKPTFSLFQGLDGFTISKSKFRNNYTQSANILPIHPIPIPSP